MKRATIISILVGLLTALATFVLLTKDAPQNLETSSQTQTSTDIAEPQTITDSQNKLSQTEGSYIDYEEGVIASTSDEKVLFFHAPWCPQCRQIEQDILGQGVPAGVTIIKVDYDTNQALRQKYGVTLQTTFVRVDDEGNELKKYVAYDEPTFTAVKENLL